MTGQWRAAVGKHRRLTLLAATLLLAVLALCGIYHFQRTATIDLGAPGDTPFVAGFFADEPDLDYRYRWSKGRAQVAFTGMGSAAPIRLSVRAQGPRLPAPASPTTATLALNGVRLEPAEMALSNEVRVYEFELRPPSLPARSFSPPYTLLLDVSTFRASDGRTLGAKVDYATLRQSEDGFNLPPLDVVLWTLICFAGLVALLSPLPYRVAAWLAALGVVLYGIAFMANTPYSAAYVPVLSIVLAIAGILTWQTRNIGKLLAALAKWRVSWEKAEAARLQPAVIAMLVALALFAALALWTLPQVVWIGHADYAENANVARNMVEGRGLTVDYTAQFYEDRPGISHPAETWPLLQPLLIAPFFALFGPETWVARLPNLAILLALAWGVFAAGSRLWDSRVGLVAGLLTLLHAYFFNSILYPINDLAFTATFFALTYLVFRTVDGGRWTGGNGNYELRITNYEGGKKSKIQNPISNIQIGLLAGLLVWSKPSGAVLLVGLVLWVVWNWWRRGKVAEDGQAERVGFRALPWRAIFVAGGAFGLVLLPMLVRNLLAFGVPFYSTEGLDAWILRYWPFYEWEHIYQYYVGSELPHPRWVVGGKFGYQNLFDAIGINFRWVWDKGVMGAVSSSEFVIGPTALVGAFLGMLVAPRRALRLAGMALFSIAIYALFVLLYWHFEGRYFQVAIPWLYLLLAGAVVWVADLAGEVVRGIVGRVVSTLLMSAMAAGLLWPQVEAIGNFLVYDTRPTSFTVAMEWLGGNSLPSDVVMTRDPWELNWHTRRRAVMIPFDDRETILRVARQYGVTMLQLGGPTDGIDVDACPPNADAASFPTGSRPALGKLYCGYALPGFTLVYKNGDLTVYRLSPAQE